MSRKITVRNKNHPHNKMKDSADNARRAARGWSNEKLDCFLRDSIPDHETLDKVLLYTRAQKIRFIRDCTQLEFVRLHNEAVAKKEAEDKAAKEAPNV